MTGTIRRATEADIPGLVELVHALAEYEKASHECHLTEEQLREALFGAAPALFAHVVDEGGEIVGGAIWFRNYSTWRGVHGIFLEDLFVKPEMRGKGYGKSLLVTLAREAVANGYARLDWSVLTWNQPSIDFYESLGAVAQSEWVGYRLSDDALEKLAATTT
ncbi:GNAT family N-acetyltransferase [Nocardia panacis]|uniref:GNAT family N-acetyltransferase n=1 Tax=Nocardia panacis TaxID=2340916 RepID=A0A3A4L9I9_9NOCA|nr:GNAT family N-acetyltransferase [Nocardia panacis]RJO79932.1 GNAT family N-acetyltransferase [Nocardia panacis]